MSNFPMQANGAEMLRLACIRATEEGVRVCAPVHDALLIESKLDTLDEDIRTTQQAMLWASKLVLEGFELRTDCSVTRYPERYQPEGGQEIWKLLNELLEAHSDDSERDI